MLSFRAKQTIANFQKFGAQSEEELRKKINSLSASRFDDFVLKLGFRFDPDTNKTKENIVNEFKRAKMNYDLILNSQNTKEG